MTDYLLKSRIKTSEEKAAAEKQRLAYVEVKRQRTEKNKAADEANHENAMMFTGYNQIAEFVDNEIPANCRTKTECLDKMQTKCQICKGIGHEFFECPTKRKCDKWSVKNNDAVQWGSWKYHSYYKYFDAEEIK